MVTPAPGRMRMVAPTGPAATLGVGATGFAATARANSLGSLAGGMPAWNDTAEGEAIGAKSVVTYGLRSVMAAPLSLRDNLVRIIYLDNRLAKGVFTEDDVAQTVAAMAGALDLLREAH